MAVVKVLGSRVRFELGSLQAPRQRLAIALAHRARPASQTVLRCEGGPSLARSVRRGRAMPNGFEQKRLSSLRLKKRWWYSRANSQRVSINAPVLDLDFVLGRRRVLATLRCRNVGQVIVGRVDVRSQRETFDTSYAGCRRLTVRCGRAKEIQSLAGDCLASPGVAGFRLRHRSCSSTRPAPARTPMRCGFRRCCGRSRQRGQCNLPDEVDAGCDFPQSMSRLRLSHCFIDEGNWGRLHYGRVCASHVCDRELKALFARSSAVPAIGANSGRSAAKSRAARMSGCGPSRFLLVSSIVRSRSL